MSQRFNPAGVARLTPLGHPAINLDGRYRTTSRPPTTGLRPLRTDLLRILYRSSSQALIDAQGVVQQQPYHGCGAQRLGAGVGVGGGDQGPGLVLVQAGGGGLVRVHRGPGHALGGDPADQVVGRAVPIERGQRRQAAAHAGGCRAVIERGGGPQVDVCTRPAASASVSRLAGQPSQAAMSPA